MRKVIQDPVGLAVSLVKKIRRLNRLDESFVKEFKEDIRQEILLGLLEKHLLKENLPNTEEIRREIMRIVSKALYHVAMQTWYRRKRNNTWESIFSIFEEEVE